MIPGYHVLQFAGATRGVTVLPSVAAQPIYVVLACAAVGIAPTSPIAAAVAASLIFTRSVLFIATSRCRSDRVVAGRLDHEGGNGRRRRLLETNNIGGRGLDLLPVAPDAAEIALELLHELTALARDRLSLASRDVDGLRELPGLGAVVGIQLRHRRPLPAVHEQVELALVERRALLRGGSDQNAERSQDHRAGAHSSKRRAALRRERTGRVDGRANCGGQRVRAFRR